MATTLAAKATRIRDAETGGWIGATNELRRVGSGYQIRTVCDDPRVNTADSLQWTGVDYREAVRVFSPMAGAAVSGDPTARRHGVL